MNGDGTKRDSERRVALRRVCGLILEHSGLALAGFVQDAADAFLARVVDPNGVKYAEALYGLGEERRADDDQVESTDDESSETAARSAPEGGTLTREHRRTRRGRRGGKKREMG